MNTSEFELLVAFELHDPQRIRELLDAGVDVHAPIEGKSIVDCLLESYTRSERLPECLALLLDRGAELADPALLPVLLDDAAALGDALRRDASLVEHRTTLGSAFTPLAGASLLHVAAEYGHLRASRAIVERGAGRQRAGGTRRPRPGRPHPDLPHRELARQPLGAGAAPAARSRRTRRRAPGGADLGARLRLGDDAVRRDAGVLRPGRPVARMHRAESDVCRVVALLLEAGGRPVPPLANVPNRYLAPRPVPGTLPNVAGPSD